MDIAKQNIITSYKQLLSAKESLEISLKRLEAGITTQREIVNTQGDVSESESNFINSITDYNINLLSMKRITGLDYENICSINYENTGILNKRFFSFLNEVELSNCKQAIK